MWHYANYHGKELLVLGHSQRQNNCFLVDMAALPMNESTELRRIAQSRSGQEIECLVPLLQKLHAPDRLQDWFSYLMHKTEQRNGPVFTLPLKDIQDSLDEDQRAIFKGYGKGRRNKYLDSMVETRSDEISPIEIPSVNSPPVNTPVADRAISGDLHQMTAPPSDLSYKMDMMLVTLVDESRKTQVLLNKLIGALTSDEPAPQPEPTPVPWDDRPAKATRRPSRSRKAVSSTAEGAQA